MDAGATVTQIGKYPVLGVLGVGGMGVVYRAIDKSVGREVAIKTLTEATEELRQRFLLEARSGILNHPNIVTVYDFGEQDGSPYIVMEFIAGDSLENMLRAGHKFSLIEKLDIIRQLCLGLGYAHQKGVIHRDIKPANIMVQPDGNIKIVDFGVARLEKTSGHTQTGMVIGTFHYISPERLLGKTADGRADIWSAGVILYLLLTGRLPFPGDDPATLHRVVREPQEPLSNFLTGYPPALDHLIDHALAKSPNDRYETAEDMATDIEAINEALKRDHVTEVLSTVQPLIAQEQWTSVRPILLDLQRLNPKNTEVKKLLRDVQDKLSRQQKTVQLRQLFSDAEEAVLSQRYSDALDIYNQALDIDPSNTELLEKIEHTRGMKEKTEKVALLLDQSREARKRSDFTSAHQLIDRALQLDERNTDLRNERVRIVQDSERAIRERNLRQLSETARNHLSARQYTDAIQSLRTALEIDPTDAETQQLFQEAIDRQEEQRRRKIIDQIVAEISESIASEDPERALVLIQRAQERLPGETVLLQLKAEAEAKLQDKAARLLVEKTTRDVYSILATNPHQALTVVQKALDQMPGETRLIALEAKVAEQTQKAKAEERKAQFLKQAQASMDAKQFDQAIQTLETATIECGDSPDVGSLLKYAQEAQRKAALSQIAADAIRQAQPLIAAGQFDAAIGILQPVALETSDPAVDQMLRKATSSQVELARRVDAVVARAESLGAGNIDQGLQLLASQPAEIQQNSRVIELRATLESAKEQARIKQEQERARLEAAKDQERRSKEQEFARQEAAKEQERQRQEQERIRLEAAKEQERKAKEQEIARQAAAQEQERIRQDQDRTRLEAAKEQERIKQERELALAAAIQQAFDTLQTHDLRSGLTALEALRKSSGDSQKVPAAITEYKNRRGQIANEILTAAIDSATQAMQREDRTEAIAVLNRASDAAEFANSGLQSNLKRLTKEAQKAGPKKPETPVVQSATVAAPPSTAPLTATPAQVKTKSGSPIGLILGIVVVVLLAAGGAAYWFFLRPAPAAPAATIEINATPFGEVVSITSAAGKAIPLPDGDHSTPMRLDGIPAGTYAVMIKGADGNTQTQPCDAAQAAQICTVTMQPIDDNTIDQIVGGAK
jgi:eukaryotic-like serine/threonine-protein kinase